jgi:hypothetical protein
MLVLAVMDVPAMAMTPAVMAGLSMMATPVAMTGVSVMATPVVGGMLAGVGVLRGRRCPRQNDARSSENAGKDETYCDQKASHGGGSLLVSARRHPPSSSMDVRPAGLGCEWGSETRPSVARGRLINVLSFDTTAAGCRAGGDDITR